MKYCKSKRGYFYKVVGDKKTRISMEEYKAGCKKHAMKGGFDKFGRIEQSDFELKENKNTKPDENSISIIKNINGIPHVFFGYNKRAGKYIYVMYYVDKLKGNSIPPIIRVQKLQDDGLISEPFSHTTQEILRIPAPILLHLSYEFLNDYTRNKSKGMRIIYDYLRNDVLQRLRHIPFEEKYKEMLDEIIVENKVSNLPELVEMNKMNKL